MKTLFTSVAVTRFFTACLFLSFASGLFACSGDENAPTPQATIASVTAPQLITPPQDPASNHKQTSAQGDKNNAAARIAAF